jgi:hypothetical protein
MPDIVLNIAEVDGSVLRPLERTFGNWSNKRLHTQAHQTRT